MVKQRYTEYVRTCGAYIDIDEFARLYVFRAGGAKVNWAKAMDANFTSPETEPEHRIKELIDAHTRAQTEKLEADMFAQRKRLADAERTLQTKTTKKAENDKRIATDKVGKLLGRLGDLKRSELKPRDSRIYPMWYAPVMIWENGRRVVKPMRYHCRPAGKPAFYDAKYPGCYNARRDNLQGFWKNQFGDTHGIVLATAFYENVSRHRLEQRDLLAGEAEENVVIEFQPKPELLMHVACIWSRWTGPGGEELLSFAAVTDEPPAEVAAAGHDRCIIPIRPDNVDAWLNPEGDVDRAFSILDERERPYYEHRKAA